MKVAGVLVLANVTIKGANFWGLERRKNVVPIRSTFKVCLVCECIHALCLSNFARPSFPSFFG